MKTKQLLLIAVLLVVLAAGWLKAMQATDNSDEIEAQNALVVQADALAEKTLYVRAIPLYQEALEYETDSNSAIEEKLMAAYLAFGETDAYISLVSSRSSRGIAAEAEYLQCAEIYLASNSLEKAMNILEVGMKKMESSETLRSFYEKNRFYYTVYMTNLSEIVPVKSGMMPVYDGSKWGYANERGQVKMPCVYDSVTSFNESGYAVVELNGEFKVITSAGALYGIDETGVTDVSGITSRYVLAQANGTYSYYDYDFICRAPNYQYEEVTVNACGFAAVKKDGKWGVITDNGELTTDYIYEDVAVNATGSMFTAYGETVVGAAKKDGKWYLVTPYGTVMNAFTSGYAGLRAPEGGNLFAFCDESGKWGYLNTNGEVVVECQYDDAYSFSDDLGAVKEDRLWHYINGDGVTVIEGHYTDAKPFINGFAVVKAAQGCTILKLDYYNN
ncbi:MAG: WG repeat-containing protein [Clostridia bacterium]|nr:WG repeat-containing protein [Clostridia bacterium]